MEPTLLVGDELEIEPLAGRAAPGEVVAFRAADGTYTCHRVILRLGAGARTLYVHRGEPSWAGHGLAWHDRAVGRVVAYLRRQERHSVHAVEVPLRARARGWAYLARRVSSRLRRAAGSAA